MCGRLLAKLVLYESLEIFDCRREFGSDTYFLVVPQCVRQYFYGAFIISFFELFSGRKSRNRAGCVFGCARYLSKLFSDSRRVSSLLLSNLYGALTFKYSVDGP